MDNPESPFLNMPPNSKDTNEADDSDNLQTLNDLDKIHFLLLFGPDGEMLEISSDFQRVGNIVSFTVTDPETGRVWRHIIETQEVRT